MEGVGVRRSAAAEEEDEEESGSIGFDLYLSLPFASPRPPAAGGAPHSSAQEQPKSGGAAVIGLAADLQLFGGSAGSVADERGSGCVTSEGSMSSGADTLGGGAVDLGAPSAPRNQDSAAESERAKISPPTTGCAEAARRFTPLSLLDLAEVGMPSAPRNQDAGPDMEGAPGSAAVGAIDLDFHLGLPAASPPAPSPSSAQPKASGAAVIVFGVDLALLAGPTESVGDEQGSDGVKSEGRTSSATDAPLDAADLGTPTKPRNQGPDPASKRVKTEQRKSSSAADASPRIVLPLLAVRFPEASRRARRSRRGRVYPDPPVAAAYNHRDMVPAWVRAEVLPSHGLPGDLQLHYVGEKVLHQSDINSRQARFLIPSGASRGFRGFLSADEIAACGFDCTDRRAKKEKDGKRAKATTYPGIPVSVYASGGAGSGVCELRLNKFHRTDGTVINGSGYWQFVGRCGLVEGDGVEVWAFRRPAQRLCFLIAKRDDVCPVDGKGT